MSASSDPARDLGHAAARTALPVFAWATGLTLNDWAAVATISFILLQASYLVWKWQREAKRLRRVH